jgi:hypothetical protein
MIISGVINEESATTGADLDGEQAMRRPNGIEPLAAKSQGECAINPVAPALANAVKNATGVRFCRLALMPDHIFDRLVPVQERR